MATNRDETMSGPLTNQIAASLGDVQALLDNNRSLSVALLARRLRDHEELVRKQFSGLRCPCKDVRAAEEAIEKVQRRLEQAALKFSEMRNDLDQLKLASASATGEKT